MAVSVLYLSVASLLLSYCGVARILCSLRYTSTTDVVYFIVTALLTMDNLQVQVTFVSFKALMWNQLSDTNTTSLVLLTIWSPCSKPTVRAALL